MSNEGIFDKVKDFLKGNPDKVDPGLDKAGELVNERTGGKYSDQVAKGDDMVRQQLGVPDDQTDATQPAPGPTPGGPLPGGDPDVSPTTSPEVPPAPNTPEPGITPGGPGSTPGGPGTTPPVTSPDPVPTTAPETVPEAAPGTAQGERL